LSDFETILIIVNEVNTAPQLTPIGNKIINEGVPFALRLRLATWIFQRRRLRSAWM
jgi:hypothetical protein